MRDLIVKCALLPDVDSMLFRHTWNDFESHQMEVLFRHICNDGDEENSTVFLNPTKARAIIAWLERALAEPDSDEPEVV